MTVASSRMATARPTPSCLMSSVRSEAKIGEHRHHHRRRRRHRARRPPDAVLHRRVVRLAAVDELLDPADDEHLVVHREPEEDGEEEERQPRHDRAVRVEAEQPLQVAVLEDPDEHAVRGRDGQKVQHDRRQRHRRPTGTSRAGAGTRARARTRRRAGSARFIVWLKSCVPGGLAGDGVRRAGDLPDRRRDDVACAGSRAPRPTPCRRRCLRAEPRCGRPCASGSRTARSAGTSGRWRAPAARTRRSPAAPAASCTFGALTTTCAGVCAPGNSFWIAMYVFTIGMLRGRSVKLEQLRVDAAHRQRQHDEERHGRARPRSPDAAAPERASPAQTRDSGAVALEPAAGTSAARAGARATRAAAGRGGEPGGRPRRVTATMPRSTRSPSLPSSAGSTVSEPTIAANTTSIAPIPIDVKIFEPASSIPAIAISTVPPEMSTAWPDVAAARGSASSPWPGVPLLPLALQVEERVVDADRHPHQQDHRVGRVGRVGEVAGRPRRARSTRARR